MLHQLCRAAITSSLFFSGLANATPIDEFKCRFQGSLGGRPFDETHPIFIDRGWDGRMDDVRTENELFLRGDSAQVLIAELDENPVFVNFTMTIRQRKVFAGVVGRTPLVENKQHIHFGYSARAGNTTMDMFLPPDPTRDEIDRLFRSVPLDQDIDTEDPTLHFTGHQDDFRYQIDCTHIKTANFL